MEKLEVFGANKLKGQVRISGSKNASLPILAATLLSDKKICLSNVPKVKDIATMFLLLKSLGSKNLINTADLDKDARPLDKGLYDGAVDTVGGNILANVLSHIRDKGIVAACGNANHYKLNTTVMPFIIRGVKLWGIDSVMISKKRREFVWSQVADLVDFNFLEKHIKIVNLEELLNIFPNILKGEIAGRVLVDLNK